MTSFRLDTDVTNGYSDAQVWHSRRGKVMKVCYCGLVFCVAGCVAVIVFLLLATGTIPIRQPAAPCDANRDTTVSPSQSASVSITRDFFGQLRNGKNVDRFTLKNKNGVTVQVITLGGIITSIKTPDRRGRLGEVTLGYDSLRDYENSAAFFGALVGRVANRIANGTFTLNNVTYRLNINDGGSLPNHLHGGPQGWDKVVWRAEVNGDSLQMTHVSPDGDEHYPGEVSVTVIYRLTDDNELEIIFRANTTKATPINLTSHAYFNLAEETDPTVYNHNIKMRADYYTPVDDVLIPSGVISPVTGTLFDLRQGRMLGDILSNITNLLTYNHNFCIQGSSGRRWAATVSHAASGRVMHVFTDQPGLQFYTGNFLNVSRARQGRHYGRHAGFTMETQNYPDAVNKSYTDRSSPCSLIGVETGGAMADYETFALVHLAIGFELDVLGTLVSGSGDVAHGALVAAILFYLVAFLLIIFMYFGDLKGNKTATICCVIFSLLAGLCLIIGVGTWSRGHYSAYYISYDNPYAACADIVAALLAIIAAVFLILTLCGCGGGGGGGSGSGKSGGGGKVEAA